MNDLFAPGPAPAPPLEVFRARRERLLELAGGGVVLVGSSPQLHRSRDTEVPYRQNTDLYYLTGIGEPETFALLTPHDPAHRFTLFVRPRNPEKERWNGPRIGVEAAKSEFGANAAYSIEEMEEHLAALIGAADRVFYPVGTDASLDQRALEILSRARRVRPRTGVGPTAIADLDGILAELRKTKDAHEIDRMRTAAAIAAAGHRAAMARARPGLGEWEIEAALEAAFRSLGATGPAFPSIVGAGSNATFLHYTRNDQRVAAGDLVLVDAGAEWGMYCSDITRTFPASGRFSPAQRTLYELVLAAENAAIEEVRPGALVTAPHDAAVRVLVEGMLALGILDDESPEAAIAAGSYRRFYMHQTSHWLGLDVHDVGGYKQDGAPVTLQPGMVLTIEPGLYLPPEASEVPDAYRGIGIRIEDSVLVTGSGREILTRGVPVDPDEVEKLVGTG